MYGGSCACCGESNIVFLTIDHVNNDGAKRRRLGEPGGGLLYKKLRRQKTLDPTLQVLCWNCNMGKRMMGGCPHQDNSFVEEALGAGKWERRKVG